MFYILNFMNHKFASTEFPEQAIKIAGAAIEDCLLDDDEIEIIDASGYETRYSYEEFVKLWS